MGVTSWSYLIYLAISIALTVWVGRTLFVNGRVFLVDVFRGREDLADSVNHLLVVGFYLLNLGYVCFALKLDRRVAETTDAIEAMSLKLGAVLLVLGAVHLSNVWVFHRIRRGAESHERG
ncbi:MAG: hypothetical protein IPM29_21460 [Planctomycetes bacterium]|nr:hypothetical protein [Planctomycetota bacterium]